MEMYTVGIWGYSFASIAYVIFSLLILAAHNQSSIAKWLLFSSLMAVCANIVAALQISIGFSLQWAMLADVIKIAAFSILIISFNIEKSNIREILKNKIVVKYLLFWFISSIVCWGASYALDLSYQYLFLLFVLLNLVSLVLLEQIYRGANSEAKNSITPLVIALGCIAVFDFVLYAQATMVGGIEFDFWYMRGYLSALAVPLLLISIRRFKEGSVRIFVSRNVVFYSSMLMIAGLYLLLMAVAGYLINYLGGEWGQLVSFGFFILGSIVLAVLLITETVRRQVKVFISKHFFANKYEYREEWLELIGQIETASSENYCQMSLQIMMSKVGAYTRNHSFNVEIRVVDVDGSPYLLEHKLYRRELPENMPTEIQPTQAFELHGVMFRTDAFDNIELPYMTIREHLDIGMQLTAKGELLFSDPKSIIYFDNLGTRGELNDLKYFNYRWNAEIGKYSHDLFEKRWGYKWYGEEAIYFWCVRRRIYMLLRWLYIPIPVANFIDRIASGIKRRISPIWDPVSNPNEVSTLLYDRLEGNKAVPLNHDIKL